MGFTKAFLVAILKTLYMFKPSIMFKQGEAYIGSLIASMVGVISFDYLNQLFFEKSDEKFVWLPIVIQVLMTFLYLLIACIDFMFGVRVATVVHKKSFDFYRVIDSIAKTFATIFITTLVMICCLIITSSGFHWAMLSSGLSLAFLWVIIILYEYSSIGNHLKSLYGTKPGIFTFMDRISGRLREKALTKIEKSFNLTENEKNDNNISD